MNAWDWLLYSPAGWQDVVWYALGLVFAGVLAVHYRRRIRRLIVRVADLGGQAMDFEEREHQRQEQQYQTTQKLVQQSGRAYRGSTRLCTRLCNGKMCRRPFDHLGPCDPYAAPECPPGCDDDHHESRCPNANVGCQAPKQYAVARVESGRMVSREGNLRPAVHTYQPCADCGRSKAHTLVVEHCATCGRSWAGHRQQLQYLGMLDMHARPFHSRNEGDDQEEQ